MAIRAAMRVPAFSDQTSRTSILTTAVASKPRPTSRLTGCRSWTPIATRVSAHSVYNTVAHAESDASGILVAVRARTTAVAHSSALKVKAQPMAEPPRSSRVNHSAVASQPIPRTPIAGAAMAYHVAFRNRDICRGVAAVEAPLPMRIGSPVTDPVQPLEIYSFSSKQSKAAEEIATGEKMLQQRAFPVIATTFDGPQRYLNSEELARLVRWIDTLDRI